ncbi:MAG: gluconokinase [Ferruginibacter sp.]|nr:gluconokinase [Ferruginibacter sp.]
MQHKVIFIMGVSGSGKTTIGQQLSAETGYPFYDADNFHSKENIAKMKAGIPLTDEDRWPWLESIHYFVMQQLTTNNIILVCSALKQMYRDRLSKSFEQNCRWVYLQGDYDTIMNRLKNRTGHYMPAELLRSQFDALEVPTGAICVNIRLTPKTIIDNIISAMNS